MLSEIGQTWKETYYMISIIFGTKTKTKKQKQEQKNHETESRMGVGMRRYRSKGTK